MNSPLILTHGDLDGMVCGILLLRQWPEAAIKVSNGEKLAQHLSETLVKPSLPGAIFVTDIHCESRSRQALLTALTELHQHSIPVHLYDHHFGWRSDAQLRGLFDTCCVNEYKTTAAVIVRNELCRSDGGSGHWLGLLSKKDQSPDPQVRMHFGLLAALMQPRNYRHTEAALRALAAGVQLPPEYIELSRQHYADQEAQLREVLGEAEVIPTGAGRRVAWLDRRAHRQPLHVPEQVMAAQEWDLVATVTHKGVILGGPGIDRGLNLQPLHGEHDFSGVRLLVAGHRTPVKITPVDTPAVTEEVLAAVRQFIAAKL
ncbi:MAG: hypothetical protein ABFE07_17470 [Armatimonadia bacterium]